MPAKRSAENGLQQPTQHTQFLIEDWVWTDGAETLDLHVHDQWQICEYLNAPGHYVHRGTRSPVAAGSFVVIPPGEAHQPFDAEVRLGARYRVWYFEDDIWAQRRHTQRPTWRSGPDRTVWKRADISALLRTIAASSNTGAGPAADLLLAGLAGRNLADYAAAESASVSRLDVARAREYLWDYRTRPVAISELARIVQLSESRLSHAFQSRFHLSPSAYGLRLRTDHGRRLLLRGRTPAEAAEATGFSDQAHFTRCFRRFVGPTPAAYRRLAGSFKTRGAASS